MSEVKTQGEGRNTLVMVVWGVAALLILLFIINNSQSIELNIAFTEITFPLWLLVLVFFGLGLAAGWVTKWWTGRR